MKKLNNRGFTHDILLVIFIVFFAIIGVAYLVVSHAQTLDYTNFFTVSTTNVTKSLDRGDYNYLLMQRDRMGYDEGLIYGGGFTIYNKTAGSYEIYNSSGAQGVGFFESSGGMTNGQTVKIHTYINPNKPDGTYIGNVILKYYNNQTQTWLNGPTIYYSIKLVTTPYSKYFTVNGNYTAQTLSRAKAQNGFVYGTGIALTGLQNTGFTFYDNGPYQGKGYYVSSGGLSKGQVYTAPTYLNTNLPNGTYTGNENLKYVDSQDVWHNGPTIYWKLVLTN